MELKFLLDSNAVINYLGAKYSVEAMNFISEVIDDIPNLSVISKIEVLSYQTDEEEYQLPKNFCTDAVILQLNDNIVAKQLN